MFGTSVLCVRHLRAILRDQTVLETIINEEPMVNLDLSRATHIVTLLTL
jgi:hypothetical protein